MATRKKYDFSSVGQLEEDIEKRARSEYEASQQIPIGIKVPMQLGTDTDGLFKMHYSLADAVSDNFRNMVMTNHGERVGIYDFGANLQELAFELGGESADTEAIRRIRRTTDKYMPFVNLLTFEPLIERFDNEHVAKIGVRIHYKVGALSEKEKMIEAIIYTAG